MMLLRRLRGERGFTLIELLISIVLLGVIVLITAGAMQISARSVDAGERKAESLERLRTSLRIIDAHIQSAFFKKKTGLEAPQVPQAGAAPPSPNEPEAGMADTGVQFKGSASALQFPSHYSLWGDEGGYVMVGYLVEEGEGGKTLRLSEEHPVTGATREAILITGARDIFFEMFHKGVTDEKGEWVEEWDDEETVPDKIRITVELGRFKNSFIVPLRVSSPQGQIIAAGGG